MAKQIRRSDIAEDNLFGNIKKSAEQSIQALKKLDKGLQQTAESIKKIVQSTKGTNLSNINKLNKAFQDSNTVRQQSLKINTEIANQQKLLRQAAIEEEKIKQQKIKTEKDLIALNKKKEQQQRKNVKQLNDERNAYQKLVIKTREQKNESKRLGARLLELEQSGKKNSRAYRELSAEYKNVTRAAQQGDKQLKKLDKTVGDNFRNVGNYRDALGGLQRGLGALGIAFGLSTVVRNVAGVVSNFDQSVTDLAAISGKTKEELSGLTEQAKELGATTQFTASEIVNLQIELAKLGFTSQQIQDSTGAIANFAAATGVEIPRAAALGGSALRAFNLEASEMERVVSVLGVATTKSALDFSKLETGLSTVAPVAASFGFSIEDTTALLGQLANAGFDASTSATATRNILLNLADANGDLAKELGRPIKSADDLAAGLQELQSRGVDLAKSLELTDKRSVAAFQTFIAGSGTLVALRDSITGVNKELQDMADKRLDSVQGQLALLNSAWEGFLLGTNESIGATEIFKEMIGFLAENLDTILVTIGKLIRAFVVYKGTLMLVRGIQFIVNGGLKTMGMNALLAVKGLKGMVTGTKSAAVGFRTLGKAMNAVPLLAMIGLLAELAYSWYDVASATAEARRQQDLIDAAKEESAKFTNEKIIAEKATHEERMRLLDEELRKRKALGEDEDELEKERIKKQKESIETSKEVLQSRLRNESEAFQKVSELQALIERNDFRRIGSSKELSKQDELTLKSYLELLNQVAEVTDLEIEGKSVRELTGKIFLDQLKSEKILRGENLKAFKQEVSEYEKLMETKKIDELEYNVEIKKTQRNIKDVKDKTLSYADAVKKLRAEFKKLYEIELTDLGLGEISGDPVSKLDESFQRALDVQRRNLLQIGATSEEIEEQMIQNTIDSLTKQIALYEKYGLDTVQLEIQLGELLLQQQELNFQKQEDLASKQLAREKEEAERRIAIAEAVTDRLSQQIDERVSKIDEEIQAAKKSQDTLRALAEQGNIDAQESLAEQRQIELELQKQRQAELRKKAQLELASSAYSTYESKVAAGSEKPLAETIRDIGLLQQFIASIPLFEEGTEDTGKNGKGVDGKGGFHAILHPNERVMTKDQNRMVGNLSNMELAQIAQDYRTGKILAQGEGASQIGGAWSSVAVIQKLDELQKTIENKPEVDYKVEEILDGVMKLRKSEKRGNTIVHNKYRIK